MKKSAKNEPAHLAKPDSEDDQISLFMGQAYFSYLNMLGQQLKLRGLDKQLKPGIGNVLFALHRRNDQTATEIGRRLSLAKSTMNRLIDKVKKLGLVETRPDPDDGRATRISLTKEARDLMPECFELANYIEGVICGGFTAAEREQLSTLLKRATSNITAELEKSESGQTSNERSTQ